LHFFLAAEAWWLFLAFLHFFVGAAGAVGAAGVVAAGVGAGPPAPPEGGIVGAAGIVTIEPVWAGETVLGLQYAVCPV
jgi:hypothetical protein